VALLLLLGAERAPAQEVSVRAGEHGGFTRLVLRVPEEGEWTLGPAPGGFEVRGPAGAEFDIRGAFRRIGRDRIAALRPRPGGRLGLDIACACHAEMFRMEGVGLVLDVIDGPPPPGALAPGPAAPAAAAALPTLPLLLAPGPPPFLPNPLDAALTAPPALPPEEEDRVARTEAAILDSVAEAARHGFLDLAPGTRPERAEEDLAAEGARILQPGDARDGRPGVGVRTGLEQDRGAPLGATGAACLAEEDFDLAGWAGGGDFVIEVPARLAALTDARDRLDPVAAEALARTYLAYGFGREARVALDLDGRSSRGRDVLRTLARLMDGEPVPAGTFADQAGCLGPVALWRALARGTLSGNDERERTAMTLALRALPKGARDAVALRLAGLFLDASDAAGAQAIAELSSPAGGEALLARADIVGSWMAPPSPWPSSRPPPRATPA
jgi:hypothetical protein